MGDYTTTGEKIGTCGRAYYATLKMLQDIAHKEHEAAYYVKPENKCSFAFPFPEYDNKRVGQISSFHDDKRAEQILYLNAEGAETHHKQISWHIHPSGAEGINIFADCPYKNKETASRNFNGQYVRFYLREQAFVDGTLHISGECIYCGQTNVFTKEEATEAATTLLAQAAEKERQALLPYQENWKDQELAEAARMKEIAKRIIATYEN